MPTAAASIAKHASVTTAETINRSPFLVMPEMVTLSGLRVKGM